MSRQNSRLLATCATAIATLALAGTAQAVDLRDWGRKLAPAERFAVLSQFNNQAVLDKETQLVWAKNGSTANTYVTAYFTCMLSDIGGRRGWRLPTAPEIASLMATGATSMPSVFAIPTASYWTTSEHPQNHQYNYQFAVTIHAPDGLLTVLPRTENRPFVCVRGAT